MSDETTDCSETVREPASGCSSPPTPKPLDYRSESKRRATVEVTESSRVDDEVDSKTDASQCKTQPVSEADTSNIVSGDKNYQEPEPPREETKVLSNGKVVQDDEQPSHSNSRSFQSLPHSSHFVSELPGPSRSGQFENWPPFMSPNYNYLGTSRDSASSSSIRHPSYPYCPPVDPSLYDNLPQSSKWWPSEKGAMDSYMTPANFHEDVTLSPGNEWSYGSIQDYGLHLTQNFGDHFERRQQGCPRSFMPNMHNRLYKSSFRANRYLCPREQGNLPLADGQKYLPCEVSGNPFSSEKSNTVHGHRKSSSVFGKSKPTRVFQSLSKSNIPFIKKKKRFHRKFIKDVRRPQSAGAILMHSSSSMSSRFTKLLLKKKKEKKDATEDPNKKALSAAADKLRKTFFASKKSTPEDGNNKDHRKQSTIHYHSTQENAEDLSIKTYGRNCRLSDELSVIDVTEKENMKTVHASLATLHLQETKALSSNSKYKEGPPCSDVSDETSDEEGEEKKQSTKTIALLQRRRYLSESAGAAYATSSVRPPRSRSSSIGTFDSAASSKRVSSSQEKSTLPDRPRVNKMLVKQLLTMDKKSLQDLVADPRSRKAQFMVNHLMSEQRSALAQRLDVLRSQQGTHNKTRTLLCDQNLLLRGAGRISDLDTEEELQILGQMEALELETLPSDVVSQVRQILLAEQHGVAEQTLGEAFFSIDDLLSGQITASAQSQLPGSEAPLHGSTSASSAVVAGKEPLQLTCTTLPLLSPPSTKVTAERSFQLLSPNAIRLRKPLLLMQPQVGENNQEQNVRTQQHNHDNDHLVEIKTMLDKEAAIQSPAVAVHGSDQQQTSAAAVTSEQVMSSICLPNASSASLGTDLRTHQAIERSLHSPKVKETSLLPVSVASDSTVKSDLAHHDLDVSSEVAKERETELSRQDLNISFDAVKEETYERLGNKSVSSDMECQIVSPPPKLPPAMITIDDSDPEEVKNFSKNLVAVRLENDENSLPIDIENDSQCDNQSSLGFTPIEEPASVFRTPLPHQIVSPQARSLSSMHFNISAPLSGVDPIAVSATAVSSHSLPMSLVPPVNNRDNVNSVVKQTLSFDSYSTATLSKSSSSTTEQRERQLPHLLASSQDTQGVSVTRSSSPLPVIRIPEKSACMNSCTTSDEPKPHIVSKISPPSTPPCQRLPSSIAGQHSTSHRFLPSTQDMQLTGTLKTKTSPPVTPPLIHPSSSLFRSPPNLPRPDKTSPPTSTSLSPCPSEDNVNRVLLHARIAARPLMPPPPVQPPPPSLHSVHLHTGGLHRNLDLAMTSLPPQLAGVNERDSSGRRAPPPPPAEPLDSIPQRPHGGVVAAAGRLELRARQLVAPADANPGHSSASARPTVKVKEETPSPQLECHLCQHLHHSPHSPQHSPQCCPYTPSPAPSVPPRPPPPMPPAHSPPSQASPAPPTAAVASGLLAPLYQRTSKQEQPLHGGSYLCENVNRPSSKERPRNPAPPNTPHRIPSPAVLPTPPRPVIFPNDPEIPERPAPPHPPAPPQSLGNASPRIKLERQTPGQPYPCCCLRNECNRSLSRASMDGSNSRGGMRSSPPPAAVPSLVPSDAASGSAVSRLWFFTPSIPDQATGSSHVNILTNHDAGHGHLHHHRHHHILHHNHHSHPLEAAAPSKMMKRERLTPSTNGQASGSRLHGMWLPSEPKVDPSEPVASVAVASSQPPRIDTDSSNVHVPSKSAMTSGFISVAVQTQARDGNKNSSDPQVEKTAEKSTETGRVDQGTSMDECGNNTSPENNIDVPDNASELPAFMRARFTRRVSATRADAQLPGLRVGRARYRQNNESLNDALSSGSRFFRAQAPLPTMPAQCFVEELYRLSTIEDILLKDVKDVDRKVEELSRQRSDLMVQLMQVQQERNDWMMQLISDGTIARTARHGRCSVPVMPFLDNLNRAEGTTASERILPDRNHRSGSSQEPADSSISLVSSSQENGPSPFDARGNVSEVQEPVTDGSVQRQRCTSTSHSPGLNRSFSKHRDLLEVLEPAVYPEETNSDSDGDVSMKPVSSHANGESPSTSSLTPAGKSNHFVFSSIDADSNIEGRVTRRRSKSLSECQDDPNSSKTDEEDNKDSITRLSVPDTTDESAANNLCVEDDLSSECKVEFNVCHNDDCPPDSLAQNCLLDQQSSHSDVPTKIFLQSPKSRNSSGSDHSYSLRSRGPPEGEKSKRCRSASQLDSKDESSLPDDISSPDNTIELEKELVDDEQTEDDGGEEDDAQSQGLSAASSVESLDCKTACSDSQIPQHRHKRKRRSRKHNFGSTSSGNKRKKSNSSPNSDKWEKKTLPLTSPSSRRKISVDDDHREEGLCPGSGKKKQQRMKAFQNRADECHSKPLILPPPLKEAVLDMKVVGNHLFTCSSSSIQCFDLLTGQAAATYPCDKNNITALVVVGLPHFQVESPAKKLSSKDDCSKLSEGKEARSDIGKAETNSPNKSDGGGYFEVITGASDGSVRVYNGQRGTVEHTGSVEGAVRCLACAWDQVFAVTHSGHTYRWSYRSGGAALEVVVDACPGGVNFLVCHREGCRRVLVMAGRHSPIIIRDAFSGLLLRSLEVVQNSVYRALFVGGQLYTAGSRSIVLYDYASGEKKQKLNTESDVCSLTASSQYLLACCYDACVRVYCRQTGQLVRVLKVEANHKLLISSAVFRHTVLVGSKGGEIVSVDFSR